MRPHSAVVAPTGAADADIVVATFPADADAAVAFVVLGAALVDVQSPKRSLLRNRLDKVRSSRLVRYVDRSY